MYLDLLIITGLVAAFIVSYKCWKVLKKSITEIYQKFDTIYYMLCDIFKKRHKRQKKGGNDSE